MEPLGSQRHTWEDPARVKLLGRRFIKQRGMAGARKGEREGARSNGLNASERDLRGQAAMGPG